MHTISPSPPSPSRAADVVDADDVRSEQLNSATSVVQKWIRGNLQRKVADASRVRRSGRFRKPTLRMQEEAAILIQAAWRMHAELSSFHSRLARADKQVPWVQEEGWAKARKQFWAAVAASPFANGAEKGAAMPKSDW